MEPSVTSVDYEAMAPWYDAIARVVSLGGNRRAQRRLLRHVRPDDRVLHAGCGSVGFNEDLARACGRVVAVDVSPSMLELTRRRLARAGLDGAVELVCADVTRYEAADQFDVVFANFFLNTFAWEDCRRVLAHLARQLRPGGLLCIADEAVPAGPAAFARPQQLARQLVTWGHHKWVGHPMHPVHEYDAELGALGFAVRERHRDPCGYITSTAYAHVG
jgi:ubiquinone/menaquinone biosynthesis C-methylase UbiE